MALKRMVLHPIRFAAAAAAAAALGGEDQAAFRAKVEAIKMALHAFAVAVIQTIEVTSSPFSGSFIVMQP